MRILVKVLKLPMQPMQPMQQPIATMRRNSHDDDRIRTACSGVLLRGSAMARYFDLSTEATRGGGMSAGSRRDRKPACRAFEIKDRFFLLR
jgi:hypothetical protein